jgi:hypothetical protein
MNRSAEQCWHSVNDINLKVVLVYTLEYYNPGWRNQLSHRENGIPLVILIVLNCPDDGLRDAVLVCDPHSAGDT